MEDYRDVNDNKIKIEAETIANVEIDGKTRQLELVITTRQTHPLLGLNWMEKLGMSLKTEAPHQGINKIDKTELNNEQTGCGYNNTEKSVPQTLYKKSHKKEYGSNYPTKRRSEIITAKRKTYCNSSTTRGRKIN